MRTHRLLKESNSNEAGRYWPGFYKVDTTTPGKEWVADYRRNQKVHCMLVCGMKVSVRRCIYICILLIWA